MPSTATDRLQGLTTSVAVKAPCVVAATTNLTLSGEQAVAGVAVTTGQRVLAAAQTDATQRLIYVVDTGPWALAHDSDAVNDLVSGTQVLCGTADPDTWEFWVCRSLATQIVPGETSLTWEQYDPLSLALRADLAAAITVVQGLGLTGINARLNYAANTGAEATLANGRSIRSGGAVGSGGTDDTAAINTCLALGGHWVVPAGHTFRVDGTLTMGVAGTVLEVHGTLDFKTPTIKGIEVTAPDCTITGTGRLLSPAVFDGTNAPRTYAVVWVQAAGFTGGGRVWLDNIPRAGVHFEDCIGWDVQGWRLVGNFPRATYTGSGATLTGHAGFSYNPPPTATTAESRGRVAGCYIGYCVQGFLSGNLGAAASEAGVLLEGNLFHQCHDHGTYGTLLESQVLDGNLFLNCKAPWVVDGRGSTVTGNTAFSNDPALSLVCGVRDAVDTLVSGNTIIGASAALDVGCYIAPFEMRRVKVTDNHVISTGPGLAQFGLRVGFQATVAEHVEIVRNTVQGGDYEPSVGAIQFEMAAAATGFANVVDFNKVIRTNVGPGVFVLRQNALKLRGNEVHMSGNAASATTVSLVQGTDITESFIDDLEVHYRTGGTNVTARGLQLDTSGAPITSTLVSRVRGFLTSPSLAGSNVLGFAAGNGILRNNHPAPTAALSGQATMLVGTSTITVANANVLATGHVSVEPNDLGAGQLVQGKGYRVDWIDGSFTIRTGDGSSAASDSTFKWVIW